jgi:hypothetical protein
LFLAGCGLIGVFCFFGGWAYLRWLRGTAQRRRNPREPRPRKSCNNAGP